MFEYGHRDALDPIRGVKKENNIASTKQDRIITVNDKNISVTVDMPQAGSSGLKQDRS